MWNTQREVLRLARQHPNFQQCVKRKVPPGSFWCTSPRLLLSLPLGGLPIPLHMLEGKPQKTFSRQKRGISAQLQGMISQENNRETNLKNTKPHRIDVSLLVFFTVVIHTAIFSLSTCSSGFSVNSDPLMKW